MKVLFLDIDGVLIPYPIGKKRWDLNPALVGKLKKAVERLDAVIVISSAWRQYDFPKRILRSFALAGWKNPPIIGKTPYLNSRGEEILRWLIENPTTQSYIILDDTTFDLLPPLRNIIQTDSKVGITDKEILQMDEIWLEKQ